MGWNRMIMILLWSRLRLRSHRVPVICQMSPVRCAVRVRDSIVYPNNCLRFTNGA